MVAVTLDSDDLEVLLYATGAIKAVEAAVAGQTKDEQFLAAKPKLTAAHDRAANAWRAATRKRDRPEVFRDPTPDEVILLKQLYDYGANLPQGIDVDVGAILAPHVPGSNPRSLRPLMVAGFLEFGQHQERVLWSSSGNHWSSESPSPRCRLTPRGMAEIEKKYG